MPEIHHLESLFLLLLVFLIGFGTLAQKLKVPYPILLVIAGLLLSLAPGLPHFTLDPDVVFLVILPPLLFSASFNTSWRDFCRNLAPIVSLSVGLVAMTTAGVALAAHWILPDFDWRLGLVLGAILSPTDAIAATSIAKRLALPGRITDILEGESLVNDATGLLALEFAIAIVTTGQHPSFGQGLWRFLALTGGGLLVGLATGKLIYIFESRIENGPIEVTASLITPYIAYLGAERLHASGVLAAVACGMYLGRRSSDYFSSAVRLQATAVWRTFDFILNGLAFLMIGLQLPYILENIQDVSFSQLLFDASVVVVVVILLRLAWVFPGASVATFVARLRSKQSYAPLDRRAVFLVGWTGMRGVISLAAAFALPLTVDTGAPFPNRSLILFITFFVILVTLVLQGLTLPSLIRLLGLGRGDGHETEERFAKRHILRRAVEELDRLREQDSSSENKAVYSYIAQQYRARITSAEEKQEEDQASAQSAFAYARYREVTQHLRQVERSAAIALRNGNEINDETLRKLERELDLLDIRYAPR